MEGPLPALQPLPRQAVWPRPLRDRAPAPLPAGSWVGGLGFGVKGLRV